MKGHEVDDMFRVARKLLAQFRVLGGDANRTGVHVANPHHDAAQGNER